MPTYGRGETPAFITQEVNKQLADNITLQQFKELAERTDKRLDRLELNMTKGQNLTLAKSGWTNDSSDVDFPYQYALAVEGVTIASRADAVLDAGSIVIASACGMCAVCDTADNSVVFKSYTAPAADLTGKLYITKDAALSGA